MDKEDMVLDEDIIGNVEELDEETAKNAEELNEELKAISEKIKEENPKEKIVEKLRESKQAAKEKGNDSRVQRINELLQQIKWSNNLECLKDHARYNSITKKDYGQLYKRANKKLENSDYSFFPLNNLHKTLKVALPTGYRKYSKLFLAVFFHYIMENKMRDVSETASRIITNIYSLTKEMDEEFVEHVKDVIDEA